MEIAPPYTAAGAASAASQRGTRLAGAVACFGSIITVPTWFVTVVFAVMGAAGSGEARLRGVSEWIVQTLGVSAAIDIFVAPFALLVGVGAGSLGFLLQWAGRHSSWGQPVARALYTLNVVLLALVWLDLAVLAAAFALLAAR